MEHQDLDNMQDYEDQCYEEQGDPQYNDGDYAHDIALEMGKKNEWECIDLKCTHFDGDRCTLGFCDPDPFIEEGDDGEG